MKPIPIRQIKPSQKEPDFSEEFTIRDIGKLLGGKEMVQELHRHDYFLMLALKKGNGVHEIDFTSYKVGDHSFFFLRPGQVHQLKLKAGSTGYLIQFKTDYFYSQNKAAQDLLRKVSNKNSCKLDLTAYKKLDSILTSVFNEYTDKQEGFQEAIKSSLNIFFIEIARHRQNKKNSSTGIDLYKQEQLDKFLALLEANITKYKQVSQYAELLHLSMYQLNAITKEVLGKTCSELINETIILESKRQLLATSNQVNQIAYHLGYEDVSYFIRFFKKHTGYSPEVYKQNFK